MRGVYQLFAVNILYLLLKVREFEVRRVCVPCVCYAFHSASERYIYTFFFGARVLLIVGACELGVFTWSVRVLRIAFRGLNEYLCKCTKLDIHINCARA